MWFVFALLSAVFAALTSILAKVGIDGVNSDLATAIRTVVVVAMSWGSVRDLGYQPEKLDFSDPVRTGYRRILAVLLPGSADR